MRHLAKRAATLTAIAAVSAAALTACATDKPAPGVAPGQATAAPAPAKATPTPIPSAQASKDVAPVTNPKATSKDLIKMYGQKSADNAAALVTEYVYAMTGERIMNGELRGPAAADAVANLVDKPLYDELRTNVEVRKRFVWGEFRPGKVTGSKVLALNYSDMLPTTEYKGLPTVVTDVTAVASFKRPNKAPIVVKRQVRIYLAQQADAADGEWKITGFWMFPDQDATSEYPAQAKE